MSFEKKIIVPGIIVYNVGLETSKNLIDSIEGFVGDRWEPGAIVNVNEKGKGEVDMQHRKCGTYGIPNGFLDLPTNTPEKEILTKIKNDIDPCLTDYTQEYMIEPLIDNGWIMLKYESSDKFEWHIDAGQKYPRNVSITYYLNDDYEGGLIEYRHFGISYKPKAGDIIIFGSDYPYMHRVTPVTDGTRYALVNWYRYKHHPRETKFNGEH